MTVSEQDDRESYACHWLLHSRVSPKYWEERACDAIRLANADRPKDEILRFPTIADEVEIVKQSYRQWLSFLSQPAQLMVEATQSGQQLTFVEQATIAVLQGLAANNAIAGEFGISLAKGDNFVVDAYSSLIASIAFNIVNRVGGGDGSN